MAAPNYIPVSWTILKTVIANKMLDLQYIFDGRQYTLVTLDNGLAIGCVIDADPSDTTDRDDFLANYAPSANKPIFFNARFRTTHRNMTGNASASVKASPGILHGISINNNATGGTLTIYDNTTNTGTIILTLRSGGALSGLPSGFIGPIGAEATVGIYAVTAGSGSNDFTIYYR